MTFASGVINLVLGAVYLGLGVLAVWEVAVERHVLGLSRFGLAFAAMAATCGPHHLLHGWAAVRSGHDTPEVMVASLIGVPAGLVFMALRLEAATGRRGDRFVRGVPTWLAAAPVLFATAGGALATSAILRLADAADAPAAESAMHAMHSATGSSPLTSSPGGFTVHAWSLGWWAVVANVVVAWNYSLVGWPLLRTQVRRHHDLGGWSLSGLSLAAIFPTCALMHLTMGLTSVVNGHASHPGVLGTVAAVNDLAGVPTSLAFLWVVRALHRDAIVDWNRRPAVGTARRAPRPAPWSRVIEPGARDAS